MCSVGGQLPKPDSGRRVGVALGACLSDSQGPSSSDTDDCLETQHFTSSLCGVHVNTLHHLCVVSMLTLYIISVWCPCPC